MAEIHKVTTRSPVTVKSTNNGGISTWGKLTKLYFKSVM